ncbi:PIG-L deacetylase family protein [Janibacter sp. GXQ6167]|uniref:PIG-L deacetylase family protein n=1 Tax=Janibacter sp. GXQ6167 TaxID=3240791 RepID=UPI00352440FE
MSELAPFDGEGIESILCVVAHPDDIEYGTAAAVAGWTAAGKRVAYYLLTSGEAGINDLSPAQCGPAREAEERASAARVGVDVVEFGGHPDGMVEYGLTLRRDIARAIRRHRPDLVTTLSRHEMVGSNVNQADHRAVGLAVLDATGDAGNRWVFPELAADEGLEPWSVKAIVFAASPVANEYIDVSDHFEDAVASLQEHSRYLEGLPDDYPSPREILEGILGGAAENLDGVRYALPLETIRR